MSEPTCPFCRRIATREEVASNNLSIALRDGYAVSPGHTLIIPKRHEPDYSALSGMERAALWELAQDVMQGLDAKLHPDGYNLGVNAGRAAGQTILHVHLHVIPRYLGDVPDPRGGVRWVIPERARYWDE